MSDQVSPNRMNLLNLRTRIASAVMGVGLLEDKRSALVKELMSIYKDVLAGRETLREKMQEAAAGLVYALGLEGREGVLSASFAAKREVSIDVTRRNIWGVRFSGINYKTMLRPLDGRGYAFMTVSGSVDKTAKEFESVMEKVLNTASVESHLRRIGDEVKKTARRINAINEVVIPKTKEQLQYIGRSIEERDREDIFRLKKFKRRIERSR
ncbi:MAG: V-type ATP synthase subunit D [Nitrospirota bacterium]